RHAWRWFPWDRTTGGHHRTRRTKPDLRRTVRPCPWCQALSACNVDHPAEQMREERSPGGIAGGTRGDRSLGTELQADNAGHDGQVRTVRLQVRPCPWCQALSACNVDHPAEQMREERSPAASQAARVAIVPLGPNYRRTTPDPTDKAGLKTDGPALSVVSGFVRR